MNTAARTWLEDNQFCLMAELAVVREALEQHAARAQGKSPRDSPSSLAREVEERISRMSAPPALDRLCATFGLSTFERGVLLMCAGIELESSFGLLCASAQGDPQRTYPTWSLALAALPDSNWSALAPDGVLRHWRLIELGAGPAITRCPLRIDERVLHYLTGVQHLDERLTAIVEPLRHTGEPMASHQALVSRIVAAWTQAGGDSVLPAVQLCGTDGCGKRTIAAGACAALGLRLYVLSTSAIPTSPAELSAFARLWEREAALSACALLVEAGESDAGDLARNAAVTRLLESVRGVLLLSQRDPRPVAQRRSVTVEVHRPTLSEQRSLWQKALASHGTSVNGWLNTLVSQFSLNLPSIRAACDEAFARLNPGSGEAGGAEPSSFVWDACRIVTRPRLVDLAQRTETTATWADLVLPEPQLHTLRDIAMHVRERATVYESWGFAAKSERGLGISALFAGVSGTGKTMAAEVLANELRLDLFRIDLSQVVSKYIGETEKNLRRVFDAAEEGGAILLFDEADALFGKRSEVKDSHDRYANIEVSYLLQRMEAYRGLAILTSNMKEALDSAFLRRIRFVVHFPFPDAVRREAIWDRIFPPATPTEGLESHKLAQLNLAGGNIRNIAVYAAFLAADAREPVRMAHILRAAQAEYAKLERALTEAEVGNWI